MRKRLAKDLPLVQELTHHSQRLQCIIRRLVVNLYFVKRRSGGVRGKVYRGRLLWFPDIRVPPAGRYICDVDGAKCYMEVDFGTRRVGEAYGE